MPTINGEAREYDGGKYQLRVEYSTNAKQITFTPYIVISKGFNKEHKTKFWWKSRDSSATRDTTLYLEDETIYGGNTIFANGETYHEYVRTATTFPKKLYGSVITSNRTQQNYEEAKRIATNYYNEVKKMVTGNGTAAGIGNLNWFVPVKTVIEWTTGKGKKKKKHSKTVTIYKADYDAICSPRSFVNYDGSITINVKVGNDTTQQVTINGWGKPAVPRTITVDYRFDNLFLITANETPGSPTAPIRRMTLLRKDESISESGNSWSDKFKVDFGDDDSGGDINGIWAFTFRDRTTDTGKRYQYGIKTGNDGGGDNSKTLTDWYYSRPPDCNNVAHERRSNSQNLITFSRPGAACSKGIIKGYTVQCSNSFPNDANQVWYDLRPGIDFYYHNITPVSNTDWLSPEINDIGLMHNNCQKDKVYRYRIWAWNYRNGKDTPQGGLNFCPSMSGTAITYNEPNAPSEVSGLYDDKTDKLTLSVNRQFNYTTADLMFIQRKIDDNDWQWVPSDSGESGIPIERQPGNTYTYTDSNLAGLGTTIKYRVAFGCSNAVTSGSISEGNGRSAFKESSNISLLIKPNPPTPQLPIKDSYITTEDSTVRLSWIHSPRDGTQQTAARVEYRVRDRGDWSTINISGNTAYYVLSTSGFSANDIIEWRAYTKGQHADYSDASEIYTFKVYAKPDITINEPSYNEEIHNLPLKITWVYSDISGHLVYQYIDIKDDRDFSVYRQDLDILTSELTISDYLFDDGATYKISIYAESSTGLSVNKHINISIKYIPIEFNNEFYPAATFDEDNGEVELIITRALEDLGPNINKSTAEEDEEFDPYDVDYDVDGNPIEKKHSDSPITHIYVYRVYKDKKVLLEDFDLTLEENSNINSFSLTDSYAPINAEYEYVILERSAAGEIGIRSAVFKHSTLWWYIYFGIDDFVKFRWNPTGNLSISRPDKQHVRYSGRTYPVIYDSMAVEETYNISATVLRDVDDGWDTIEKLKILMAMGGHGIWKSFEGDVYTADFDFSYTSDYTDEISSWDVSIQITRTESGDI